MKPQSAAVVARTGQRFAAGVAATTALAIALSPISAADATANLKSRVDSTHRAAGCPAYQSDSVLDELAQRNTAENESYNLHNARIAPFENTLNLPLMQILDSRGYSASKAHLIIGYGRSEADSIYSLLLQGVEQFPDCTYTKYGANGLINGSQGYVLTAVILAST